MSTTTYRTIHVRILGTVRGAIWQPGFDDCTKDVDHTFKMPADRHASTYFRGDWPGSLRDAVISEFVTGDGDFQSCQLEPGAVILVTRQNPVTGTTRRRTWEIRGTIEKRTRGEFNRGFVADCLLTDAEAAG